MVSCSLIVYPMFNCRWNKNNRRGHPCPMDTFSSSVKQGPFFLCLTSTKLGQMCLAQRPQPVTPVRLEPTAPQSPNGKVTTSQLDITNESQKVTNESQEVSPCPRFNSRHHGCFISHPFCCTMKFKEDNFISVFPLFIDFIYPFCSTKIKL